MKLVKTIVATAVIVFALTTVAMAGVQRLAHGGEGAALAAAAGTAVQPPAGSVTLSARQFAALLGAVAHDGDRRRVEETAHERSTRRARSRAEAQVHAAKHTTRHAQDGTSSGGGAVRHTETRTQVHTGTHAQVHSGTHGGGTHHDGGCD
jgi:hypothetical protein